MKNPNTKKGFTLVETIIYVAIASMLLVTVINAAWSMILSNSNTTGKIDTYYYSRLLMQEIQQQIKGADDLIAESSVFAIHPGVLALDYPADNDVIIDTYTKEITVGGLQATIRKLQITVGALPAIDLTPDQVNVTNFVITNLTRGSEPANIKVELSIEKSNPGGDPNYDASIDLETSISLRE